MSSGMFDLRSPAIVSVMSTMITRVEALTQAPYILKTGTIDPRPTHHLP